MPVLSKSGYKPPAGFSNGHIQTIYPSLFRRVDGISYTRKRIETPDGDFLDIDMCRATGGTESDKAVIISHGLEGNTDRAYVKGIVRCLSRNGFDCYAWNFRGCSGEMNRKVRFYHSGDTGDIQKVIEHVLNLNRYTSVFLAGFSMGGNITLKYLGESGQAIDVRLKAAVAFSVPCDLKASSIQLSKTAFGLYTRRFIRMLKSKIRQKAALMPDKIDITNLDKVKTFRDFDNRYTAGLHGFKDADDYWEKSSCIRYMSGIRIPALLINARNDPFLTRECYPGKIAQKHEFLYLETPKSGGHTGFIRFSKSGDYWHENRAVAFFNSIAAK